MIQYVKTNSLTKGTLALQAMYRHLTNPAVKAFIDQNCAMLHEPLTGDTEVPLSRVSHEAISAGSAPTCAATTQANCTTEPGIYVFDHGGTVLQCGQSICVSNRLGDHKQDYSSTSMAFYDYVSTIGGLSVTGFQVIVQVPNYATLFTDGGGVLTDLERYILNCYTRQLLCSLEQAIHSATNPVCWKNNKDIAVQHSGWKEGHVYNPNGKTVTFTTSDGTSHTLPSMTQAAAVLDVKVDTLRYNANCLIDHPVKSKSHGLVIITMDGVPWVETPSERNALPSLDVSVKGRPYGAYAVSNDQAAQGGLSVVAGPYVSVKQLCQTLGIAYVEPIRKYLNKRFSFYSPVLGFDIYLASNMTQAERYIPTSVKDLTVDGPWVSYRSIASAVHSVNPKQRANTSFAKKHIDPGVPYEHNGNRYLFQYTSKLDK